MARANKRNRRARVRRDPNVKRRLAALRRSSLWGRFHANMATNAHGAAQALAWARGEARRAAEALDWHGERAEFQLPGREARGLTFEARLVPEEENSCHWYTKANELSHDWLGVFTDHPDGREAFARFAPDDYRASGRDRECRYFVPAYGLAERREAYRRLGYARGPADEEARLEVYQDMRRMEEHASGQAPLWCLDVRCLRNGVELARTSLGMIDSDGSDDYVSGEAREMAEGLVAEARETLAGLRR